MPADARPRGGRAGKAARRTAEPPGAQAWSAVGGTDEMRRDERAAEAKLAMLLGGK